MGTFRADKHVTYFTKEGEGKGAATYVTLEKSGNCKSKDERNNI